MEVWFKNVLQKTLICHDMSMLQSIVTLSTFVTDLHLLSPNTPGQLWAIFSHANVAKDGGLAVDFTGRPGY